MPSDFRMQSRGLLLPPTEEDDASAGDRLQRYEQLKVSVHALRSQLRARPASATPSVPLPGAASQNPRPASPRVTDAAGAKETASGKLLRLQSQLLYQEEIGKLRDKLTEKEKKIESLSLENAKQKKKLESRIHNFDKKCRALETQLAESTSRAQEELAAQERAQAMKRENVDEMHRRTVVELRDTYDATISDLEKKYQSYKTQSERTMEDLAACSNSLRQKVTRLEEELAAVCLKSEDDRLRHQREAKEWNLKLQSISKKQEDEISALRKEMEKEKEIWENDRKQDDVRRASEMQGYKLQKVKKIDTIAERVRLALETKDTIILLLKGELTKLHQHLNQTTQCFQEQASDLLENL